jgi:uncharacterized protein (TIGR02147 family)
MAPLNNIKVENRPLISDFRAISDYLNSVLGWKKNVDPTFSVRKATSRVRGCSPTLVTQVLKGRRSLTLERVPQFSKILELSKSETMQLERRVRSERLQVSKPDSLDFRGKRSSDPKNQLLQDWLNVYVKDLFGLKSSESSLQSVQEALSPIASPERVERSLSFLLRHGYLRKNLQGRIVKNEHLIQTTDEIPSKKIRAFHKRALEIAKTGIDLFPPERRQASALVMALSEDGAEELKELLKDFYDRLMTFTEMHANDDGRLYQVLLHLTPIGWTDD